MAQKAKDLPPERQLEVLDFVEFIQLRQGHKRPRRSRRGLWKDLNIDTSPEEIDEARRERCGNFPGEDI
jgi:hypothetical protein